MQYIVLVFQNNSIFVTSVHKTFSQKHWGKLQVSGICHGHLCMSWIVVFADFSDVFEPWVDIPDSFFFFFLMDCALRVILAGFPVLRRAGNNLTVDWEMHKHFDISLNLFPAFCRSATLDSMSSEISFLGGMVHIRRCLSWKANPARLCVFYQLKLIETTHWNSFH